MDMVVMYQALDMMWKGMLGIFVVVGIIALIVYALGKMTKPNT